MQLKASYYAAKNNWQEIPKGDEISFLLYCFPIKDKKIKCCRRDCIETIQGFDANIVDVCRILQFPIAEFGVACSLVRQKYCLVGLLPVPCMFNV